MKQQTVCQKILSKIIEAIKNCNSMLIKKRKEGF